MRLRAAAVAAVETSLTETGTLSSVTMPTLLGHSRPTLCASLWAASVVLLIFLIFCKFLPTFAQLTVADIHGRIRLGMWLGWGGQELK